MTARGAPRRSWGQPRDSRLRGFGREMKWGLMGLLVMAAGLTAAPAALAKAAQSTNWAGYAVHRDGVSFRRVSANWTQPNASCAGGQPSYSSAWVGLGGYSPTSDA